MFYHIINFKTIKTAQMLLHHVERSWIVRIQ